MVLKVWDWNSTSVTPSWETNFFLYSWKSDIDENGSLNYHTTYKNYQNVLQIWWWSVGGNFSNKIFFSDEAHFTPNGSVNKQNCCIWGSENSQVIKERPLHLEKSLFGALFGPKVWLAGYRPYITLLLWKHIHPPVPTIPVLENSLNIVRQKLSIWLMPNVWMCLWGYPFRGFKSKR